MQVHITKEDNKFGFSADEITELLQSELFQDLRNLRIRGVMGMATYTENSGQIREEFRFLKRIFEELKASFFSKAEYFDKLSFGMSGDYQLAIEEGSNMVRIGSLIFGPRNY